jgi:hypothetical protein
VTFDWSEPGRLPPGLTLEQRVFQRDLERCVKCGTGSALMWSCHHRKLRSQGGADGPENRITLCGSGTTGCHGWAHHNRDEAAESGWCVRPWDDPADVPVMSFLFGRIRYAGDWTWSVAA